MNVIIESSSVHVQIRTLILVNFELAIMVNQLSDSQHTVCAKCKQRVTWKILFESTFLTISKKLLTSREKYYVQLQTKTSK